MDYSKLSDFEINKLIENIVRPGWQESDYRVPNSYCNNPADAWPIIVENKISIMIDDTCTEWSTASVQDYCDHSAFSHSTLHANPLRSAMITYLMMQEAK